MVTRYTPSISGDLGEEFVEMEEHLYGDYVTYEDYEDLLIDKEALERKLKTIKEKVENLSWEF
jgi:hypothetical protein